MKKTLFIFLTGFVFSINAQVNINDVVRAGKQISQGTDYTLDKKWFSFAELEFLIPKQVRYNHNFKNNSQPKYSEDELKKGVSFGLTYSINYPIFNKLSLGAVGSFDYQTAYNITTLKFGGKMNYHFTNYENATLYLQVLHNTISNKAKSEMGNVRLGLLFPIEELGENNVTLNFFWDHDFYRLNKPLISNEIPNSITFTSFGVSIGIQF